jgi:hypothetical protein
MARLFATCVSFVLCLVYLLIFPANALGMAILIAIGTLLLMLAGRRDDIGLLAITTAVIMIVAAQTPDIAWQQPLRRLADTVLGVVVGMACKWIASYFFFHFKGEEVR